MVFPSPFYLKKHKLWLLFLPVLLYYFIYALYAHTVYNSVTKETVLHPILPILTQEIPTQEIDTKCVIVFVDVCSEARDECEFELSKLTLMNIAMNKPLTNNSTSPLICNENGDLFEYVLITNHAAWQQRFEIFNQCSSDHFNIHYDKIIFFEDIITDVQLKHLSLVTNISKTMNFKGDSRLKRIIAW
eukprot:229163_1